MGRGARTPNTELEHLAAGLGQAEDPYMIADLVNLALSDLADMARKSLRYSAVSMIQSGRVFMAIKKKLPHGEWEDFVHEQKWSWNYVRASMKLLEVVARFPQTLHLPPGRATNQLLRLPMPEIEAAIGDLPPKAIEKLTPWDLERIYQQKAGENRKSKPRKPRKPLPEALPDIDQKLTSLWHAAHEALLDLSEYRIDPIYKDQAQGHLDDLGKLWERASYNMYDPEHKTIPRWEIVDPVERALDDLGDDDSEALH